MELKKASTRKFSVPGSRRIRCRALPIFCRSLAALLDTGMPLGHCLRSLEGQQSHRHFRAAISWIRMDVESGNPLSDSIRQFPSLFDSAFCGMINAAENTGRLPETLLLIASMLESSHKLRQRILLALLYPAFVLLLATGLVLFLATFVLPNFIAFYASFNTPLPRPSLFLLSAGNALKQAGLPLLMGMLLFFAGLRLLACTHSGRHMLDQLLLGTPILGALARKIALARFSRIYATLLRAGVATPRALTIAAEAMSNLAIADSLLQARTITEQGQPLSTALQKKSWMPREFVEMIRTGENSGRIDEMLDTAAGYFENEVQASSTMLATTSTILVTVFVGIVVGAIAIAALMPLLVLPGIIH